jgi:antitoxin ParD1/3/4
MTVNPKVTRKTRGRTNTRVRPFSRFSRKTITIPRVIGNLCQPCYHDLEAELLEDPHAMPTRNVNLTAELNRFVATKVKSGRYENASEVVRAGLRTLEREERQYEAKLAALRAAIDEGDASGIAKDNVFGRVRKTLKLPAHRR